MITAIIETLNEDVSLARALAALVPAATEGVIRDVIVIDRGSNDATREVADAAGCTVVEASGAVDARRIAVEQARGDWLLFTPASHIFEPEWQAEAMAFIDRTLVGGQAQKRSAIFRGGRLRPGLLAWLRSLIGGGATARLVAKSAWLAEQSRSTSLASAASRVSGVRRGAA
jgi:glycosyltransferase involved in cell wall biosynthesis